MKQCPHCHQEQELDQFSAKHPWCKTCKRKSSKSSYRKHAAKRRAYRKDYVQRNADAIKAGRQQSLTKDHEYGRLYHKAHKEEIKARKKKYYEDHPDKLRSLLNKSKKSKREYAKRKKNNDLQFKIKTNIRIRLRCAIRTKARRGSAVSDLGCTIEHLIKYIESLWKPNMSWDNWGKGIGKWQIHHLVPLHQFDLTDRNQLQLACNYSNLVPMWTEEHIAIHGKSHRAVN